MCMCEVGEVGDDEPPEHPFSPFVEAFTNSLQDLVLVVVVRPGRTGEGSFLGEEEQHTSLAELPACLFGCTTSSSFEGRGGSLRSCSWFC
mmetsp:Transcript_22602/g.42490  ORF Transcript_22602/g.42490 Transcript_22602/m.42490 type:complete len:90 (-) Transcript_22602:161-430(-)